MVTLRVDSSRTSPLVLMLMLAAAPAIGLGIGRFAYALVLPDMRADLGWSYATAGLMNTTNAAGYLLGALLASRAMERAGAGRTTAAGTVACVVSLALCAVLRDTVLLNLARTLAGLAGGFAFVAGGVMAADIATRNAARASFLLSLYYAGPGLGIMASGLIVPFALDIAGPGSWPLAWALLAAVSAPLAAVVVAAARRDARLPSPPGGRVPLRRIGLLLAGYFCFGAGYITYMTFMIAWVRDGGGPPAQQALFWFVIGAAALGSPWLWAGAIGSLRHGQAFALLCGVTAAGAALPILHGGTVVLFVSAALFGSAFFTVVASMTAFVQRNFPAAGWGRAIGVFTVWFGIGQTLGPLAVGLVNDLTGGLSSGLAASALLLAFGSAIGFAQRDL